MKYIVHRRFRNNSFNLPAMTECESVNDIITYQGREICYVKSHNAHQFFACNDDGNGMLRGKLTQTIQSTLAKYDDNHQARWDKVWDDPICQPYRRADHEDMWLWNHEFYNANIDDLKHIAELVGAKV